MRHLSNFGFILVAFVAVSCSRKAEKKFEVDSLIQYQSSTTFSPPYIINCDRNAGLVSKIDSLIRYQSCATFLLLHRDSIIDWSFESVNAPLLERIELDDVYIKHSKEFFRKFNNIKMLDIMLNTTNSFINLGDEVCELNSLKEIHIQSLGNKVDSIGRLPDCFFELPNLEDVAIMGKFNFNDDRFLKMKKLKHLALGHCGMKQLPDFIFALQGLEELYVGGNPIEAISPRISELKNLKTLGLWNTPIEEKEFDKHAKGGGDRVWFREIKNNCKCQIVSNINHGAPM